MIGYKRLRLLMITGALLLTATVSAQHPKREMRATWLTTVANIDWPTYTGAESQKKERLDHSLQMALRTLSYSLPRKSS